MILNITNKQKETFKTAFNVNITDITEITDIKEMFKEYFNSNLDDIVSETRKIVENTVKKLKEKNLELKAIILDCSLLQFYWLSKEFKYYDIQVLVPFYEIKDNKKVFKGFIPLMV